jgi:hypothetical protein
LAGDERRRCDPSVGIEVLVLVVDMPDRLFVVGQGRNWRRQ